MTIYFIILFLLLIFSFNNRSKTLYIISFVLLCILGVFRGETVGTDNLIYQANFNATTMDSKSWSMYTEFEPGFAWIMAYFKTYIIDNFYVFRGVIFIVFMFGINFLIQKNCKNAILALFLFVLLLFYTGSFNIMRQYAALGLFCFILPWLTTPKKLLLYEISVLIIAFFIHRTIIIMTVLPIFLYVNVVRAFFANKRNIIITLCLSYIFVFLSDKLYILIPFLSKYFAFMGERYIGYINTSIDSEETISKLSSLFNTAFAIYVVTICPKDNRKSIYFICFILSICVANVFGAMSTLFLRISTNLALFKIILFTNMWYSVCKKSSRNYFRLLLCIYGLILFSNAMIKNFGSVVPYKFLF